MTIASPNETATASGRELPAEVPNPLGLEGIEFIEYTTSKPQALGQVLEMMGFSPVARHRSREVMLYRQGCLNVIVNAHEGNLPGAAVLTDRPQIAAIALRVRDAAAAYQRAILKGAWAVPVHVEVMELNIPAVHGVGSSRIYFIDRHREFSIYDVDFIKIPGVSQHPPAVEDLHFFGVVQYIGNGRSWDWIEFYQELFGFTPIADDRHFGIMHKGRILQSPCKSFFVQLIEPEPGILDVEGDERLQRIGLGCPDVLAAVAALRQRGMAFVESSGVHSGDRGALSSTYLGSVVFELVHDVRG